MARVAGVASTDAAGAQRALEAMSAIAPGAGTPPRVGDGPVEPVRILQEALPVLRLAAADLREPRLEELAERAGRWHDARQRLKAWLAWRAAARVAEGAGLRPVVAALADGTLAPAHAVSTAERAVLSAWLRSLRAQSVPLKACDPAAVERLADAYDRAFAASRSAVGRRAAAAVRSRFRAIEAGGAGGVRDQLAKLAELRALQRPRRSIRTLIRQTSGPLAALKPVVLASPLAYVALRDGAFEGLDTEAVAPLFMLAVGLALRAPR